MCVYINIYRRSSLELSVLLEEKSVNGNSVITSYTSTCRSLPSSQRRQAT